MARDINQVLIALPRPNSPNTIFEMTNALYASLSDAQVARLQNKELVSASEWAPQQCDLLGTLNVNQKFSSLPRKWQQYEEFLSAIPASRLKLMKIPSPETG